MCTFRTKQTALVAHQIARSNIFLKYAVQHISEWSPKLDYGCFNANHQGDSNSHDICVMEQTDERGETQPSHTETVNTEVFFERCMVPYYWRLESDKWKEDFPGDVCTFYHPFYFLQQINKNNEESRELRESEDA